MTRASIIVVLASASFFGIACGGIADIGDAGNDDAGGDAPHPTPADPKCPTPQPSQGDVCTHEGVQCEYGTDIRWTCNQLVTCSKGTWDYAFGGDPTCPTPAKNPGVCPATLAEVNQGASCNPSGTMCDYSTPSVTNFCSCNFTGGPIQIDGGNSAQWECNNQTAQGCPLARPQLGTTCSQPSLGCTYDVCGFPSGLAVQCDPTSLTWSTGFGDVCAGAN